MGEDGWGEVGWWQCGREQLRTSRAPGASTCEQRTTTITSVPPPPPSAAPSPHARRGSARLTHKAGCRALEDLSTPEVHMQSIYREKKMKTFTSSNYSLHSSCPLLLKNKKQEASTGFACTRKLAGQGWLWRGSSSPGLGPHTTTDPSVPISYISGGLAPTLPLWMINPTLELVEEDFKSSFTNFVAAGA